MTRHHELRETVLALAPLLQAALLTLAWLLGISFVDAIRTGDPDVVTLGVTPVFAASLTALWLRSAWLQTLIGSR